MIRQATAVLARTARLALGLGVLLAGVDAVLRRVAESSLDVSRPIRSRVVVEAPVARVWAVLSDLPGQPRWMRDLKSVRIISAGPIGPGTKAIGRVRILGISVADPIEIAVWQPPSRFGIRHLGMFAGHGDIALQSDRNDRYTVVTWEEVLLPPVLPRVLGLALRPVLASVFRADLVRLARLVESTDGADRNAAVAGA